MTLAIASIALVSTRTANAVQIYDNGAPNLGGGNEMTAWIQSEQFQLASASAITSAQFWTLEFGRWDGTLDWYIFDGSGATPGAIIASGAGADVIKTNTGNHFAGAPTFSYTFSLAGVPILDAGTSYFFGLHLSNDFNRDQIYWETASPTGGNGVESSGGSLTRWSSNGREHAFNLSGDVQPKIIGVPDSGTTLSLLGLAMVGMGVLRRKLGVNKPAIS